MGFRYQCQSCQVCGEMDEYHNEFPCPQCGGRMIPIGSLAENGNFTQDDLDAPTTSIFKKQLLEDISNNAPKRPVKIAKTVDLGFAGMLSKTATGPYKRPGAQTGPLTPLATTPPQINEEELATPPSTVPHEARTPGQTSSGKKKFFINKARSTQNLGTSIPAPQHISTQEQKRVSVPPLSSASQIQPQTSQAPPSPQQISPAEEQAAIAAEKLRIEADEAARKELIQKEALRIAEEQIKLAKEESERSIAEEKAKLAKKTADDAELTKKIAEEAAKKAIQEASAFYSEKLIFEKQKAELEANERIKNEMAKLEEMKKEFERAELARRTAEEATKKITQETSPPPEKINIEKQKADSDANEKIKKELEETKKNADIKIEDPKLVSKTESGPTETISPPPPPPPSKEEKEKDTLAPLVVVSQDSGLSKRETDDKKTEGSRTDETKDISLAEKEKVSVTPELKSDAKIPAIPEKEDSKKLEDKKEADKKDDKTSKPPLKKPLFPDKKKKSPGVFPGKKPLPTSTAIGVAKVAKPGETNNKDKVANDKKSEPDDKKSTDEKKDIVPAHGITNSGLIRLKKKKTGMIYTLISIGALLACALIIWTGIQVKKMFDKPRKNDGTSYEKKAKRNLPIPKESKLRVEYNDIYNKVKAMPTANKSDINKQIAEWEAFINKYPNDQDDECIMKAKIQLDTAKKLSEMY